MTYSITQMKDAGAYLTAVLGYKPVDLTTASGTLTGSAIDRSGYQSGLVVVSLSASLGAGVTSNVTVKVQHSSVSTAGFGDLEFADGSTVGTLTVGDTASTAAQSALSGVGQYSIRLTGAKKYIKVVLGENLTTATTVTATGDVAAVVVFGGKQSI